ncbi:MAG: PAS domain S-box protein [Balneolales bacterium]
MIGINKTNPGKLFHGHTAMARYLNHHDWSAIWPGAPVHWPQELRISTSLCLELSLPAALFWGSDFRMIFNDAWAAQTGGKPEENGKPAREVFADRWESIRPHLEQVLSTGKVKHLENLHYTLHPLRGSDDRVSGILILAADTVRHNGNGEERLAEVFKQAPSFMCILKGPDHVFERVNDLYRQLAGNRQILGKPLAEALPDTEDQGIKSLLDKVYETGETFTATDFRITLQRNAGMPAEERFLDFTYQPLRESGGTINGIFVQGIDQTGRKRTELLLLEQKRLLELIASGNPLEKILEELCQAVPRLNRQARSSILITGKKHRSFSRFTSPDRMTSFGERFKGLSTGDPASGTCGEAVTLGRPVSCPNIAEDTRYSEEWRNLCLAHGIKACHSKPITDMDGQPIGSFMLCFDQPGNPDKWEYRLAEFGTHIAGIAIEQNRIGSALREGEERFRTMVESATEYAIFTLDPEGRIDSWNTGAGRLLGWSEEEVIGRSGEIIFHGDDGEPAEKAKEEILLAHKNGSASDERPHVRKDGSRFWASGMMMSMQDDQGKVTGFVKILQDQTERKQREERDKYVITLSDTLRPLSDPAEILNEAARVLARHLDISRVNYGEISDDGAWVRVTAEYREDVPSILGRHQIDDYGPTLMNIFRDGHTLVIPDVTTDERLTEQERITQTGIATYAYVIVPLVKKGRPVAFFVAHQSAPRTWTKSEVSLIEETAGRTWAAVEQTRAEEALRVQEEQLRRIFQNAPIPIIIHADDGEVLQINNTWMDLTGYTMEDASVFKTWLSQAYGIGRNIFKDSIKHLFTNGQKIWSDDFNILTRKGEKRIWNFSASSPGTLHDGRRFIVGMALDITGRKQAEYTQRLLLGELNHRVKNTLATIQSIATQTLRQTTNPEDFVDSFNGRIRALSAAHTLLTRSGREGAYVGETLRRQLALRDNETDRVDYSGPAVFLASQPALHLALVIHELGTNARKYGALASPKGRVGVDWKLETAQGQSILKLTWSETGGPEVKPPEKTGFGRKLIEQSLKGVGGEAVLMFKPPGLQCSITLPIKKNRSEP